MSPPLRRRVDLVLLVTGSSLSAVVAARAAAAELRAEGTGLHARPMAALVIGEGRPYKAGEISHVIGLPVIETMPFDPGSATVFSCGVAAG